MALRFRSPATSAITDSAGNDVIHGHWDQGDFGNLTEIKISRIDNAAFDLNYFLLTSNTDTGGAPASGNERAFIRTSNNYSMMLPPENWGFPAVAINLDSNFDNITSFSFFVENAVDCFGMDEFFLNEEAPTPCPNRRRCCSSAPVSPARSPAVAVRHASSESIVRGLVTGGLARVRPCCFSPRMSACG